jgi:hypothetical protein
LRRLFNEGKFQARKGEFTEHIDKEKVIPLELARKLRNATPQTKSQYVLWLDANGNTVVEIHRYLNPDGTIAGSGGNDPKRITIKGVTYGKPKQNGPQPKRLTNRQINEILDKRGIDAMMTYANWLRLKMRHLIYLLTSK